MKVVSRQQVVAITKFRIKNLRRELREEEEVLRHDLQRLRKEKMNGQSKTDSNAAYDMIINGIIITTLPGFADIVSASNIQPSNSVDMLLWIWSNDTYTLAEVKCTGTLTSTTGVGITKRSPTDTINATAGMRIAVRRALDDWLRKRR